MILRDPTTLSMLPPATLLLCLLWLSLCAYFDLRTRHIPNWLTLPAIPLALMASWLVRGGSAESPGGFLLRLVVLILPLFIAWRHHLLGGADLKILLALSLVDPRLPVAAWMGALLYFVGLLVFKKGRALRFAGVPGFALGTGLLALGQLALILTQYRVA
jgi:Flp pilus assembly protein protease CpaA